MSKKIGILFMSMGTVLLVAALSLLLCNRAEAENAGVASEAILPAVVEAIEKPTDTLLEIENEAEIDTEMTVAEIEGYGYIGYLSIPVLNLELPVMSEWDYTRLKIALCRYHGSTKTDDLVICGHNYERHFGRLKSLQQGDLVTFKDMDGAVITYRVQEVEILQPTQTSEMSESGYDLTLFTCTYGGKTRVTVRCDRLNS